MPARKSPPDAAAKNLHRTLLVYSVTLTLILSSIYIYAPRMILGLQNRTIDIILATAKSPNPQPGILVVDIDEASLKHFGQWPWPRHLFARLLREIQDAGAGSIGIDVIFPEQDRSSPKNWQETLAKEFGYIVDTSGIPLELLDYDIFLARTLEEGPFVLGYEFLFDRKSEGQSACQLLPVTLSRENRSGLPLPGIDFHKADQVICNYPPLASAAPGSGFLNGIPDLDGLLRRLPLLIGFNGQLYPSFALAVVMQFAGRRPLVLQDDAAHIARLSFADIDIPIDAGGNILIGPPPATPPPQISASDFLQGKTGTVDLNNKIVLVGSSASGLAQGIPTPFASFETLLNVQSNAIHTMLSKHPPIRASYFILCETAAGILVCVFLIFITARWKAFISAGVCFLTIAATWIGDALIMQHFNLLFSPFFPTTSILSNCVLLTILKFRHSQLAAKAETGETLLLLRSSETNLQSILQTIPDIVFRLDAHGNIVFVSPAICKYMEKPRHMLGKPIFAYVAPEDRDKARHRLNERRTGERATFDLEIRLLFTKMGQADNEEHRFFSVSAEGIYRNDGEKNKEFLGTQGIVKDITDRKRLEQQLVQAQKMEVVGNLASGIAHDLNNILSGLVSYPDLLLLEIPTDNPLHDKIVIIQKSGQKAATIVQDLLTLARRSISISGISNMNTVISDYLNSLEFQRLRSKYPDIAIDTNLDSNLFNIKGSSVHLSKVIMNLLHNGFEAMPTGGRLTITTCNKFLDTAYPCYETIPVGEYACTSVADTGIGIPQVNLHRIFEPFYSKKTPDKSGTGLGMTVIWATVKDHNGFLDITSQEGEGTTLTIYLPITRESADTDKPRMALEDYLGSETILVVDDIAEQRKIVENMLEKLGYSVVTAASGEEALTIIQNRHVDLVILDMIMPGGIDGLETYREILKFSPNQKAIINSGFSESERVKELQHLGAGSYVQKPFTLEAIGIAVRNELDQPDKSFRALPH